MTFPSFEQGWAEYMHEPSLNPIALPSASQNCLNMLDQSIRRAYTLAYQSAKAAHEGGVTPDWTSLWFNEVFSALPESHPERMKAHFNRYFQTVACFVAARTQSEEVNSDAEPADKEPADDRSSFGDGQDDDSDGARSGSLRRSLRIASARLDSVGIIESNRQKVAAGPACPDKPRSVPTLSNAARESLRGFDTGIHQMWLYCGLHRWRAGGLVEEVPLTFDQAGAEASANGPADQWSSIRERWKCRFCRAQHHEQVGQTSNLAKHLKKCPRAPH
ncbi:hypothetical protein V8E36_002148 [Tilletia maclaganii]